MTHLHGDPCPLGIEAIPHELMQTCCALPGGPVAAALRKLRAEHLDCLIWDDMTCEEAIAFGEEIRQLADNMERAHPARRIARKTSDQDTAGDDREVWPFSRSSTFADALVTLRHAAGWFDRVGTMGFAVDAWW